MRKGIKVVLFTGLGILVAGVIICAIVFAVHGFNWRSMIRPKSQEITINLEPVTKTVDEDFDILEVDVASAEVSIKKSTDGTCRIEYMDDPDNPQYEITVQEGKLTFKNIKTDWDWDSAKDILDHVLNQVGTGFNMDEKAVTVYLPEKAYKALEITSASGDIRIEEALTFADAVLSTASGEVHLKDLQGVNSLTIVTASGNVDLSGMSTSEDVTIMTTSGDVRLAQLSISKDLGIGTASGEVNAEQVNVTGNAQITTASGQVFLKQTVFAEGGIHTASGDVRLEDPEAEIMSIETASGDVEGTISAEYNVSARSASGDIQVPSGTKGNWEIETASGDIRLRS